MVIQQPNSLPPPQAEVAPHSVCCSTRNDEDAVLPCSGCSMQPDPSNLPLRIAMYLEQKQWGNEPRQKRVFTSQLRIWRNHHRDPGEPPSTHLFCIVPELARSAEICRRACRDLAARSNPPVGASRRCAWRKSRIGEHSIEVRTEGIEARHHNRGQSQSLHFCKAGGRILMQALKTTRT